MNSSWKAKLVTFDWPFKILSAIAGAVTYCCHMNYAYWLFFGKPRPPAFRASLFLNLPKEALLAGGVMGYVSAATFVLWCGHYYRTASFIARVSGNWALCLGGLFIAFLLSMTQGSFASRLQVTGLYLVTFGMPFFWGLVLRFCAGRLANLQPGMKT